jgi:2-iminobutanoate/2-iminopropanoate deaminase
VKQPRQTNSARGVPDGGPLFPPIVRAGELVFVSGQAAVDGAEIVPGTFAEEMERSMANLATALSQAGLTFEHIVKVNAYVDDPNDLADYNALYPRYFPDRRPARTTLIGCLGGVVKFEIDAIASSNVAVTGATQVPR